MKKTSLFIITSFLLVLVLASCVISPKKAEEVEAEKPYDIKVVISNCSEASCNGTFYAKQGMVATPKFVYYQTHEHVLYKDEECTEPTVMHIYFRSDKLPTLKCYINCTGTIFEGEYSGEYEYSGTDSVTLKFDTYEGTCSESSVTIDVVKDATFPLVSGTVS